MSSYENPFFILGLHPQVVKDIANSKLADLVDAQYKAMSKIYHPDRGGDPEKYRLIREAFDDLQRPTDLRAFADQYRATKQDYLEMMNNKLLTSKEANTSILKSLSDFIMSIGSEKALPNLEPGWVFAGITAGGILAFEVGENHLITSARQHEKTDRIQCAYDGEPIPTGYYFAKNGLFLKGVQVGKVIERKEYKPSFRALEIQNGFWYRLEQPDEKLGIQYVEVLPQVGKTEVLSLRPAFMVRQAKSGEGNPSAEFILEKQFKQFKISKPQIRRGKSRKENLELNLESLYSQLEPLPSTGTDLFVRDEEGYIDTLLDNKGLREFKKGIQFIIPPPQEKERGGK